jgi:hypothetical protein
MCFRIIDDTGLEHIDADAFLLSVNLLDMYVLCKAASWIRKAILIFEFVFFTAGKNVVQSQKG